MKKLADAGIGRRHRPFATATVALASEAPDSGSDRDERRPGHLLRCSSAASSRWASLLWLMLKFMNRKK